MKIKKISATIVVFAILIISSASFAENEKINPINKSLQDYIELYGQPISETMEENIKSLSFFDKKSKCKISIDFKNNISTEIIYLFEQDIKYSVIRKLLKQYGKIENWILSDTNNNIPTWHNYRAAVSAVCWAIKINPFRISPPEM